jgi:hypothetical protein
MTEGEDGLGDPVPGGRPDEQDPAAGLAEAEARRALDAYPRLGTMAVVFACVEQVGSRWRILATGP